MVAAARKYKKVVQVGTQRKAHRTSSRPRKQSSMRASWERSGTRRGCAVIFMQRNNGNPPTQTVPDFLDYEMWTGPAPLRPYDGLPHIRWWRTFMEYGNGIMGDMCVHMLDTVRWMLKLNYPNKIVSHGGILVQKEGKSNIADTQTAIFQYDKLDAVWTHRTWGEHPPTHNTRGLSNSMAIRERCPGAPCKPTLSR